MSQGSEKYEEIAKGAAALLYEVDGIKFGNFTLTSGKTSPYYIDLRIVPSHPELFDKFTELSARVVMGEMDGIDRMAGVPTGGLPFAALVAYKTGHPLFYTRKKAKEHGRKKSVEGVLEEGDEVAVLDDISTTGGSIKDAVETIRDEGGTVEHALVMVDREEGAAENLQDIGVELHSCMKISGLVDHLKEDSLITEKERATIIEYLESQG